MPTTTGKASELITFSRTSNATLVDSDGLIKWAPHNLLLASEQFDAASWNKYLATVSANTQAAPNGTTTADTVTASAGNDVHRVQRAGDVAIGASANCSLSIFVKAGTHNFVTIGFYSASEVFVSATFNLASGSAATETDVGTTSGTIVSTEKVDVGTGWYRLTITGNYSGSAALSFVNFAQAATGNSYTNFGQPVANLVGTETFHLWGAHLYRSDLGGMKANTSAYPMYNPTTPKNLLGYTESFDNAAWAVVTGTATRPSNTDIAPNGLQTADTLAATSADTIVWQTYVPVADCKYTGSIYLKRKSGSGTIQITVDGATFTTVALTTSWQRFSATYTALAGSKAVGVKIVTSGDEVYAWGAQLSDSASLDTYVPNYGAAPTAAAYYGPRLDADPVTLAQRGLLVEELRSNTIVNSSVFSGWTKATATVLDNQVAGPDGTTTAGTITATAANGEIYTQVTSTSGVAHTGSIYVKRKTGTGSVYLIDAAGGRILVTSSITTGSWTRISVTANSVSVNPFFGIRLATSGDELYIWGAQLEAGSFATSYIPTGAATATRNADVASVSTQAFPYSATEGTLIVNATSALLPSAYTNGRAAALNDGTGNNVIELYISQNAAVAVNAVGRVMLSGVPQTNPSKTITNSANPHKVAFAYKASDFAVTGDGLAPTTETSGSVPSGITQMQLGALTTSNYLNGHIRQITYLPRRISNAELITRTS